MINFIVVGKCRRITTAVLLAIHSSGNARSMVIGGPETIEFRWSMLCKRQITIDLYGNDDARFAELVAGVAAGSPDVVLIPADCDAARLVNRMRGSLHVNIAPIPDSATLDMFDNKWSFHRFCAAHALSNPETRLFASKSALDYDAVASDLGVPFVVKPLDKAGSTGVHVVTGKTDFETAILHNPDYDYGRLIAQRYIDGPDIDISMLAIDGRVTALAVQQAGESYISFLPNAELEAMAVELCRASGYHGVMHVDARMEAATGKMFLIESNPRFWASLTAAAWCGLNFVTACMTLATKTGEVQRLASGTVFTRNPLIRPSAWRELATDRGERGRLLRATAFDPPALNKFVRELPLNVWRFAGKRTGSCLKGLRRTGADAKLAADSA